MMGDEDIMRCERCGHTEEEHEGAPSWRTLPDGRVQSKYPCGVPECGCPNFHVGDTQVDEDLIWMRQREDEFQGHEPAPEDDAVSKTWGATQPPEPTG